MIARLQAFYGGDPMRWLSTPVAVLSAMAGALPRLQAEDTMLRVQAIGVGTGSLEKGSRSKLLRSWEKAAAGKPEVRKLTPEERKTMLRAVGIKHG